MKDFVHLHLHTCWSLLDGLQRVDQVFKFIKELGQKAVAITEHGNLASVFDAYQESKKTGIKFIPGMEAYFVHSYNLIENTKKTEKRKHLVLLAKNHIGYKNLLKINYLGFQHGVMLMGRMIPRISWDIIEEFNEGIIATSACGNGIIANLLMQDKYEEAIENTKRLANIFKDNFYLEIQPHNLESGDFKQLMFNSKLIQISKELNLPLVVCADCHYLRKEDAKVHDVLLAINSKKPVDDLDRHRYDIDEFYIKNGDEIYDFLVEKYDIEIAEEAVNNTVKIADMIEEPTYMDVVGNHLPIFSPEKETDYQEFIEWRKNTNVLSTLELDKAYMRFQIVKGFKNKFGTYSDEDRKIRWDRVKKELPILEDNNFCSYMLITSDYIKWAKQNEILVGVGRGSVGGSLIAYLLEIHGVDPLEYGLLFERFQNAYKKDLPDIDTDFTSNGRDKVKEYVIKKYGKYNCAQVSNINTYTPKNVIPDLVKSMRNVIPDLIPEGEYYVKIAEDIKASIPDEDENGKKVKTLEYAMTLSPKLRDFAAKSPDLMKYADAIIGNPKDYATHAGGFIISDLPIYEFAPLRIDKNGDIAVQYEKNRCELSGLVKMDFLAISTLDIIDETFKNIKRLGVEDFPTQMKDIPLDDQNVYETIKNHSSCIFQLGKFGIMPVLCKQIKPKNILDLAFINALGRPSAKEIRNSFVNRRNGVELVTYLHQSLEPILNKTFGYPVTEEQLMDVAKHVAGWDLNKADGLRKLTKLKGKNPELALKLEQDFIDGMVKTHNVSEELGKRVWDMYIADFAKYGFNLAHAVFYSINGYITAYLKHYYPSAFLAAYLKIKTEQGGLGKEEELNSAKSESRRLDIRILPPDINQNAGYEVLDKKTIVMGLSAIKGIGGKALEEIIFKQPFSSFADFLYKIDSRIINKTRLDVLAKAGCFDSLNVSRKSVAENGKAIKDKMNLFLKKRIKDGYDVNMVIEDFPINLSKEEWSIREKLNFEQEVLGELVSGDMNDLFPGFFTNQGTTPISRLKNIPNKQKIIIEVIVKNLIRELKVKNGKSAGQKMGKYLVEDIDGTNIELTVWPEDYRKSKNLISIGYPIRAVCEVGEYNGNKNLVLISLQRTL